MKWTTLFLVTFLIGGVLFGPVLAQGPDPVALTIEPQVDATVDRLENGDLHVQWMFESDTVDIYGGTNPDSIDRTGILAHVEGENKAIISGLDPKVRTYFELVFAGGEHDGQSLIAAERILPLEGAFNFRDIGGYRTTDGHTVRWGQVFRSSQLTGLTDDDLIYLSGLGIQLVCDFRGAEEAAAAPDRLPAENAPDLLSLPIAVDTKPMLGAMMSGDADMLNQKVIETIFWAVDNEASTFGQMLTALADPAALPAVVHCAGGKDRAGIATALLLAALGVPDETIVADFSLSNLAYDDMMAIMTSNPRLAALNLPPEILAAYVITDPAWMEAALAHIKDTYGSVEDYLRSEAGVDDATLEALRANLLQ